MSVQTGLLHFDDKVACRSEVDFLLQGLEERAPDYASIHVCASLGMGFRGFAITPEDRPDQPLTGPIGSTITFDGRLDNRAEIALRLGLNHVCDESDAALVLSAFDALGTSAFELLAGEYACVVRDKRYKTLYLVRSRCGTRPLFYTSKHSTITWSSEIDHLVLKSGVEPAVNNDYAIGYLYYQPDIDESPFLNVTVVPPGTYIEVKSTGEIRPPKPTWHPENTTPRVLSCDAEYEEALRHEVERAVASRLRAKHTVFCELSGGLDSSTVALVADGALAKEGRARATLTTISCTYEKSVSCDETPFIKAVEQMRGLAGIHLAEASQQATLGLEEIEFTGVPNTGHCFPGRYRTTEQLMRRTGARVLLTGIGGDHLFWADHTGSPELADLLSRGHWLRAILQARKWSQAAATTFWTTFLAWAVSPITMTNRFLRWQPSEQNLRRWATDQARHWAAARGRSQGLLIDASVYPPSLRVRVHIMRALSALISAGYFQEYHSIYFSHPLADQQLVDFILSLPMEQLVRPGEDRSLMRRATRGVLPERVRTRRSKGSIDEMFCRALEREQHTVGLFTDLEVCRREYAEPRALAEAIREVALGRLDQSYALVRLFSLERWLRSLSTVGSRRLALHSSRPECAVDASSAAVSLSG